jgi:hypothetical protein
MATTTKIIGYTCFGRVRGQCGIKHETRRQAERCCQSDHEDCRGDSGYSDRHVAEIGDDGYLYEEIETDQWIAADGGASHGAEKSEAR